MARALKTAPILETERLRLRPFKASDLKALHALYSDAENLRFWGTDPSPSLDETRRALRWHVAYHPFQGVVWADPAGEQAVGSTRQAARLPPGGRPDPRPLVGRRQVA